MPRAGGSRPLLLAAAIVLVSLSAGLALRLMTRSGEEHGTNPGPGRRPTAPASALAPVTPQIPHTDLTGLRWSDFHGVELPSSPIAGPHDIRESLASRFADTPLGALLAALNIGVRANAQWGPAIFGPTIRGQMTGAGVSTLLGHCWAAYHLASQAAHVTGGRPVGKAYVTEEAFRWVTYTPSAATVDLVSEGPGGQGQTVRAVTRIGLVWAGGDWRVIAPPGGDWGNSAHRLFSLDGYTTFPGQGDR